MSKVNGYQLSRKWHKHITESKDNKPIHTALVFMIIEIANISKWPDQIELWTNDSMSDIGVKDKKTYFQGLRYLHDVDFISIDEIPKSRHYPVKISFSKSTYCRIKQHGNTHSKTHGKPDSTYYIKENLTKPIKPSNTIVLDPESNRMKKTYGKTNGKKITEPLMNPLTKIFCDFYLEKKQIKYDWTGKDSKQLSFLIKKFRSHLPDAPDEEITSQFVAIFLHGVEKLGGWLWENFTMPILNSKSNEIFQQVKISNNGQTSNLIQHAFNLADQMYPSKRPADRAKTQASSSES